MYPFGMQRIHLATDCISVWMLALHGVVCVASSLSNSEARTARSGAVFQAS